MRDFILNEEIRKEVYSILTEILGSDATGIYCNVQEQEGMGYGDFYSTLSTDEEGNLIGFGNAIYETDNTTLHNGASRFVILPEHTEYVIKLPITGVYDRKDTLVRDDDVLELWESLGDVDYYCEEGYAIKSAEFTCCCVRSDTDLMDSENALYDEAKEMSENTADMLLPNEYVGDFNGIPVWIQRKVSVSDSNYFEDYRPSAEENEAVSKVEAKSIFSRGFLFSIARKYGNAIFEILETINILGLDDLHGGNIGYLKNGDPVIFDFAGYDDETIWDYKAVLNY